jgi:hypothetical protein
MTTKIKFSSILLFFVFPLLFISCSKDDETDLTQTTEEKVSEFKYLRILVSDEINPTLTLVNPNLKTTTSFEAKFPKSALYTSDSGRFGTIIHRDNNFTETFDTGLEFHGDHVDIKGTPKFGVLTGVSSKPTHFKSNFGEILTFNDGDGTLAVGKESEMHNSNATMQIVNAGLLAHHGAMAVFNNGTYAITEKDNTITGALPERVKIINKTGTQLFASTIATLGIHGNASDGQHAVFGSASGILVVKSNGEQELIPHPEGFGTTWFGTILETSTIGNFVGYTAAKGAFLINVLNKTVRPIYESTDIMQCKISYDNNILGILLHSGNFVSYNLTSMSVATREVNLIETTVKTSTKKPQMVLTQRFVYITAPATGELQMFNLKNTSESKKIKVSNAPYRLSIMGFENSIDH